MSDRTAEPELSSLSAQPAREQAEREGAEPARERVVVVGGGLAGLLAARRHARAGRAVTLLEAEGELGGAIAAAEVAGVPLNIGAEAYSIASGAVDSLLAELDVCDQVTAPVQGLGSRLVSAAGVHRAPTGGLFGIPGRPLSREARAVIGWRGALRASLDRVMPVSWGLRPGATVGSLVRTRMGRRVVDRLVAPLVGGVHSSDPDALELAAVLPRLPDAMREHGSLAAAVRALRPVSRAGASAGTAVRALMPTMAVLPEAIAQELRELGAELRVSCPATALARAGAGDGVGGREDDGGAGGGEGGGWVVSTADGDVRADRLVLACPPEAARALLAAAEDPLAALVPEAPPTPVRLVALVVDQPALDARPSGTGALVAAGTPGVRAKALTHASAKWRHVREAADGLHVVRLSYGRAGEELPVDDAGGEDGLDGSIIDLALADAAAILRVPLAREHLRGARVITWSRAMRRAAPGHRRAMQEIDTALAGRPELELVGSWRAGTGIDAIVRADARARDAAASP